MLSDVLRILGMVRYPTGCESDLAVNSKEMTVSFGYRYPKMGNTNNNSILVAVDYILFQIPDLMLAFLIMPAARSARDQPITCHSEHHALLHTIGSSLEVLIWYWKHCLLTCFQRKDLAKLVPLSAFVPCKPVHISTNVRRLDLPPSLYTVCLHLQPAAHRLWYRGWLVKIIERSKRSTFFVTCTTRSLIPEKTRYRGFYPLYNT